MMKKFVRGALAFGLFLPPTPLLAQASDTSLNLVAVPPTESGVAFVHNNGGGQRGYIVEGMSAGLAIFDYDGDGWLDIYFLNGTPLKGTTVSEPLSNALYRNNGDWTFTDVTQEAGVGAAGYGLGVAVADYDGDGDSDIYVNNFGANVLYRNNGDKTFTDVTAEAGVANGEQVGAGAAFVDIDGDDDLDLYVANYVDFTYANHVPIISAAKVCQAGPQYYKPVRDTLYRNEGNGRFVDVSDSSGIGAVAGPGMGLVCADFDDDGDADIYVCNDGKPNFLFENDGQGQFQEIGMLAGAACDFNGKANSSMGVDVGDYNRDGLLDLISTNYQAEMPVLNRNLGGGLFDDATALAGITHDLYPHVNWGVSFSDFDNDGHQDLFIACGHFDSIEMLDDRTSLKIRNYLLKNVGGRFVDVSLESGSGMQIVESSRGSACDDLDNDGDLDVVVLNSNAAPTLLRNDGAPKNHWLQLELEQGGANREGVGARVRVSSSDGTQVAEVLRGRGYQSHFGSRLHFGLGANPGEITVQVRWPDGTDQQVIAEADRILTIERE